MDLEEKQDDIKGVFETIRETNYLDPLYNTDSKLSYEVWRERSSDKKDIARVFYQPQNLRALTFTHANIDFPESADFAKFCKENKVEV